MVFADWVAVIAHLDGTIITSTGSGSDISIQDTIESSRQFARCQVRFTTVVAYILLYTCAQLPSRKNTSMGLIHKAFKVKNTILHPIHAATRSIRTSVRRAVVPKTIRKATYTGHSVSNAIHNPVSSVLRALDIPTAKTRRNKAKHGNFQSTMNSRGPQSVAISVRRAKAQNTTYGYNNSVEANATRCKQPTKSIGRPLKHFALSDGREIAAPVTRVRVLLDTNDKQKLQEFIDVAVCLTRNQTDILVHFPKEVTGKLSIAQSDKYIPSVEFPLLSTAHIFNSHTKMTITVDMPDYVFMNQLFLSAEIDAAIHHNYLDEASALLSGASLKYPDSSYLKFIEGILNWYKNPFAALEQLDRIVAAVETYCNEAENNNKESLMFAALICYLSGIVDETYLSNAAHRTTDADLYIQWQHALLVMLENRAATVFLQNPFPLLHAGQTIVDKLTKLYQIVPTNQLAKQWLSEARAWTMKN